MYNKLFTKILDSSIWLAPDSHRLVWITLVAAMDEDSIAHFACAENLAARARVSLKHTESAITSFEAPDPLDPDQEYEGRRIERVPGGWYLLNGAKYRSLVTRNIAREQTRLRVRKFREKREVTSEKSCNVTVTPSESYAVSYAVSEAHVRSARDVTAKALHNVSRIPRNSSAAIKKIRASYPRGIYRDADWLIAEHQIATLIDMGTDPSELVASTIEYELQQQATGSIGTQFIKAPSRFFGSAGEWRGPFPMPDSKAKVIQDKNVAVSQAWLAAQENQDVAQ